MNFIKAHFKAFSNNRKLLTILIILLLLLLSTIIISILSQKNDNSSETETINNSVNTEDIIEEETQNNTSDEYIAWGFNDVEWTPSSTPPECVSPLTFDLPIDATLPTSILFPGQYRGGDYKAHGGLRFDNRSDNLINVTLPLDSYLVSGSRYIESGNIQYILDFVSSCGIAFRFDHLAVLSSEVMAIVDNELPAAKVDDTRGTFFKTPQLFKAKSLVATAVGNGTNLGMDFGVYDYRSQNSFSLSNPEWAAIHADKSSQTYYAICWLDNLTSPSKELIKSLRQIGNEGNVSDYCEIQ